MHFRTTHFRYENIYLHNVNLTQTKHITRDRKQ